ncbi:hypothetical protein NO932_09955 [Pelagibacterium sp. 26DY04]|uniref:hypothetical protein n=1 Tax=unclassified Pelagibacterium TaxID=2623280 RepID=UPI002814B451|nr:MULTISPECIES: hypothetical protein [unclassified Pelagibacterium]WMT85272.1 hypothetical protein NO932_09955 [Pelagibacterium sp. 26DY04]WMT90421.1 hypothetical protein NO934_16790 [Pelagibacterium sp. H642]
MTDSIWIHYCRPRPHWYGLDQEQKEALERNWEIVRASAQDKGAAFQGRFHIRGQHDFQEVEIWRFPETGAIFEYWSELCAARYNQFFAFSNNIGLEAGS